MPIQPVFERAIGFWTAVAWAYNIQLISFNSQTTDWYTWTYYCAETSSALSSLSFILVGALFNSWPLYFAGAASVLSHCIPFEGLLLIDKLGVIVTTAALAVKAPSAMFLLPFVVCLGLMAFVEVHLRRRGWHHVHDLWHVGAAMLAAVYLFLITNLTLWKTRP